MGKGATLKRVAKNKWAGVYFYALEEMHQGRPDVCYYITFKDPASGRKIWEKIGKRSEGYSPDSASEIRSKRMRTARHEGQVKTQKEIIIESHKQDRTIEEIADTYFADPEKGMKLKGRKTDLNRWENHLKPVLGKRRVSSLSELDVKRVKKAVANKSAATVWNVCELMRRLCNYGAKVKLCPPLPFVIEMPTKDNEVVEFLQPEEYQRLQEVLNTWPSQDVARMLKVAMFSGMRRGELFKLKRTDIDFQHKLIRVVAPKGGKTATIPLSTTVEEILKTQIRYLESSEVESEYIFPGRDGDMRKECTAVRRIKKKAQLPKSFRIFHGLRHHFAVKLANSGKVDLTMLQDLLTHKSPEMTRRYGQFLPETKQKAANLAAELIQADGEVRGSKNNVVDIASNPSKGA